MQSIAKSNTYLCTNSMDRGMQKCVKNSPASSVFIHCYIVGEAALIKWLSFRMNNFMITTIGGLIAET